MNEESAKTRAPNVLVEVRNLKKYFPIKGGVFGKRQLRAVDDVSFDILRGETLGLVGESGCGKSTLGRTLIRLYQPTAGQIKVDGVDIAGLNSGALKTFRRQMQIIFQDPSASLNPRRTIHSILLEPFRIHRVGTTAERETRILELLDTVGLSEYHLSRYPYELSGGQKQRVGIARALALTPKLIVCDEAVSALDVSIQAQIINLLKDLQVKFNLTYLFISHNLSVVHHISDRVAVMYLGQMIELATHDELYETPLHPYTEALISAIPEADPTVSRERILLTGDVPSPANPPSGCRFHTRCPYCTDICRRDEPALRDMGGGHFVACHLASNRMTGG